ncbi:MAG: hypothetical protein HY423_00545 [Candidatus Lambdaproteobacteria bacterium]|nr:hypothetical protein [Candidatus Lambdaproteobacteria bacterium]
MDARNRLDIYTVREVDVGLFREPFDQVIGLEGFQLRPRADSSIIWHFENPSMSERGLLLDVQGFLSETRAALSVKSLAYLAKRPGSTLALALPPDPRRIRLSRTRYREIEGGLAYPAEWPKEMILQKIRFRLSRVLILDERFFLDLLSGIRL